MVTKDGENMSDVIKTTMKYCGVTVKVTKLKKAGNIIRGSVDGNKYGMPYDKTIPQGFSDKALKDDGFTEGLAGNGGIFYPYENDTYAEGIEISKGINNQDFGMSCVSNFNECMAVGFPKSGGLVFAKQKEIMNRAAEMYGALTFAFGIMKDGQKCEWGKDEHAAQYNCISGRNILGQNDEYIFQVAFSGTTGKSGLYGYQLFALCDDLGMKDAGCWDGGGSVFKRVLGDYLINTTRKVKNAWMIFFKKADTSEPSKEAETVPETDKSTDSDISFRTVKCVKGTLNNGTEYPTRATIDSDWDRNKYKIKVGDRLIFDDVKPINGKPDCYFQIVGGDRPDLMGRWFAYDKDYFD